MLKARRLKGAAENTDRDYRERMTMVTAMGIEKHAEYYRGYQPDDRSIWPVAIVLATMVALWLLVYLIAAVGPQPAEPTAAKSPQSSYATARPISR